jgi:hypothetical protein
LKTEDLIKELNPTLRGWGDYYKRAHVRTLFHKLDGWIVHASGRIVFGALVRGHLRESCMPESARTV